MNIFKKKEPKPNLGECFFCHGKLDVNYGSLSYEPEDGHPVEYGRICSKCSDILDAMDREASEFPEIEEDDGNESI